MANIPVEISDDDDGFDWEAAVMEIDVACEASKPSTLFPTESLYQQTSNIPLENDIPCPEKQKRPGTARQSTLDKFISRADQMPFSENPPLSGRGQDGIEGDGRVCNVDIDTEAAKTWIYPVNVPLREYQFSITKTALFSNTLVALPTGLGKTLIAAVVMYNYFRWFPEGKIIFAAPSRPLVVQQIEACHNIVGIPQEWTIDLTGHTSPTERASLWKAKRVFFVTPQVLENDIQSGTCMVKYLVCLVIDEAHKASGNSSYCVAVRELMAVGVQLRILALTATPGSKQQAIQHIIDNLHISSLEYRNESDPDVSKYVHNRTIELKQVSMGQDADEITNLLVDAMRPLVTRLSATGVLLYRDVQILSPINVLDSRNKFRQAPPPDLQHTKYGEIEGYFGVLLTLCHLRKLLSSHGIKQAYDMLDEKLKQGGFARLMSRNEFIGKAKFLMQKNLSHGAPDPKISKMLEVLIDHFKNNDPQSSRIIIFSNFRGSVRDIMDALGKVGGCVKASEFIGQSKGKTSKGQTQKAQQAILEGFRAGRYNVIVATSIGEEGLDIMEVDLVICFDANVSPLRMIQRMGRTGRKHNGRVVVLACEGSELTGYTRKQASGKSIGKHMRNGGMNSFNFHSSPRMIPHIFKPEVQCVEMSIIQFVPRGRKVKDDHPKQAPMFNDKISDAETESIAKYFHPNRENTWRPSLIAFPHFQAFPSRVHKVMHSFKTGLLIDTMQHLQGLSYSSDIKSFFVEDGGSSGQRLGVETVGQHTDDREDSAGLCDSPKAQSERCVLDFEISPRGASKTNGLHEIADLQVSNPIHSYLFGSDFVSVDALGKVLILSVPFLPLKQVSHSKCTSESRTVLKNCLRQNLCTFEVLPGDYKERPSQAKAVGDATISSQITCTKNGNMLTSTLCKSDVQQKEPVDGIERILQTPNMDFQREETLDGIERIPHTPNLEVCVSGQGNNVVGTPGIVENKTPILLADDFCNNFEDTELSPRLTNLIKSGVVPESPIGNGAQIKRSPLMMSEPSLKRMRRQPIFAEKDLNFSELSNREGNNEFLVPGLVSPAKLQTELLLKSSSPRKNEMVVTDSSTCVRAALASPMSDEFHSPLVKMNNSDNATRCISTSPVEEINAPLANLISSSCSKDWHLSFNDKSESVAQAPKFKRLRKHGDVNKRNMGSAKENSDVPTEILPRCFARINPIINKLCRGKKKSFDDVRDFIQEEAEVSPNAGVSDDEEDEEPNSHDNSFIDDRINPTAASTQAEGSSIDIMAIYRRSLLSQSPMVSQPDSLTNISPDSVTRITGSGSSSIKTAHSLQTPQTESENQSSGKNSVSHLLNNPSEALPSTTSLSPKNSERTESRKRRLSFNQFGSVPVINLEQDFLLQSETAWKEPEAAKNDDVFDDDEFYAGLDLEALEAQATMCLRSKSEPQRHEKIIEPISKDLDLDLLESPSFDLGI